MALYKENTLYVYNSLKGFKEVFHPTVEGRVGMYVCMYVAQRYIPMSTWATAVPSCHLI